MRLRSLIRTTFHHYLLYYPRSSVSLLFLCCNKMTVELSPLHCHLLLCKSFQMSLFNGSLCVNNAELPALAAKFGSLACLTHVHTHTCTRWQSPLSLTFIFWPPVFPVPSHLTLPHCQCRIVKSQQNPSVCSSKCFHFNHMGWLVWKKEWI